MFGAPECPPCLNLCFDTSPIDEVSQDSFNRDPMLTSSASVLLSSTMTQNSKIELQQWVQAIGAEANAGIYHPSMLGAR